jgi:hypothetical protein
MILPLFTTFIDFYLKHNTFAMFDAAADIPQGEIKAYRVFVSFSVRLDC